MVRLFVFSACTHAPVNQFLAAQTSLSRSVVGQNVVYLGRPSHVLPRGQPECNSRIHSIDTALSENGHVVY